MASSACSQFCAFIVFLGLVAHILGFLSPYWILEGDIRFGLWMVCGGEGCSSFSTSTKYLNGWYHALQALECLGLILAVGSFVTSVIFIKNSSKSLSLLSGSLAMLAACSIGCGLIIYAVQEWSATTVLGWAFFVECAAAAILLPVGVLFLMVDGSSRKRSREYSFTVRYVNGEPTSDL